MGGIKESIVGVPGVTSRLSDVAFGNIELTSHVGNFSASSGPFGTFASVEVGLSSIVTITAGFGLSTLTLGPAGIEMKYLNNSIALGPTGIDINGTIINLEALATLTAKATGIATVESSAVTNVKGSIVMLN